MLRKKKWAKCHTKASGVARGGFQGVRNPLSPSLCYDICFNFKENEILAAKENGKKIN